MKTNISAPLKNAGKPDPKAELTPTSQTMIPLRLCLTYDPPQIGVVYKKSKTDTKKQIYIIQLNSLIFIGEPDKITQMLYEKHAAYLSPKKIKPEQVEER